METNSGNTPELSHLTGFNPVGTPAPVPEPGTLILMGVGFVGLVGLGRKRITK